MTDVVEPDASTAASRRARAVDAAPFELHAGALRLAVRADLGGAVAGLWHGETPILRSSEPARLASARESAMFPLVPYSNRLGYRRFRWRGTRLRDARQRRRLAALAARPRLAAAVARSSRRARSRSSSSCATRPTPTGRSRSPRASTSRSTPASFSARLQLSNDADGRAAGRPRLAPVLRQAAAQPDAHRALAPLGRRRDAAADAQGRAARHRQRPVAPRLRQLLRRLARAGADPRRALLAPARVVAALPRRLHAARARLLLRRAGEPRQQRDPHGRAGGARPGRARAGATLRRLDAGSTSPCSDRRPARCSGRRAAP